MAVYILALGAALLFGISSVVQQRVASVAPPGKSLRPSLLLWLLRQPMWLLGLGTSIVGNVMSSTALGYGSVALVQPLLVARLLCAIPLSAVWTQQRMTVREVGGMVATAGGLALFVAVGRPREVKDAHPAWWEWVLIAAVILALTAALVYAARKLSPEREAAMLGAGAGMLFALQSGFTHSAVGGLLHNGILGVLLTWTTYAVALAAIGGTLLAQSAYEMAPLAASYPTLAAIEPIGGIAIGVGILGTTLAFGLVHLVVFVFGLGVMTLGIYLLATSKLVSDNRDVMERRHNEEVIADLERRVDDELCHLEAAVVWLERCRSAPQPAREAAVRTHRERAECRLGQLDEGLARLDAHNTGAEEELAQAIENVPDSQLGPEDRALRRYHQENRRRERELHTRADALRTRARAQLELADAGR